jgi:DNA-binding NarL/FixJ family response regulator
MITDPIDAYRPHGNVRSTASAAGAIALVIEEAMALWTAVTVRRQCAGSVDEVVRLRRAARLLRAAEVSYVALGGSPAGAVLRPRPPLVPAAVAPTRIGPGPRLASANALSPREVEVLHLVAAGRTDREIADALGISRRTATTHVTGILNRIGAANRTAAAAAAVRAGLA